MSNYIMVPTSGPTKDQTKRETDSEHPHWLDTSLTNKKRNLVLASVPIDDMVNKIMGRTPKTKRLNTMSKIDFDEDTKNWTT